MTTLPLLGSHDSFCIVAASHSNAIGCTQQGTVRSSTVTVPASRHQAHLCDLSCSLASLSSRRSLHHPDRQSSVAMFNLKRRRQASFTERAGEHAGSWGCWERGAVKGRLADADTRVAWGG